MPSVDRSPLTTTAAGATAAISATAAWFIVSGYGSSPRGDPLDRAVRALVDPARLDLAEVQVVHRRHSAQQFAGRSRQRPHADALELVLGVGLESVEADHPGAVVDHHQVVGDGRDVHAERSEVGAVATHGRRRRPPSSAESPRRSPLAADRRRLHGRGHSASTAATIAAASSSVGVGRITGTGTVSGTSTRLRGAADGTTVAS